MPLPDCGFWLMGQHAAYVRDYTLAGRLGWNATLFDVRAMDELDRSLLSGWLAGQAQARADRRGTGA